jgi:hypothetical protein
MSIVDSNFRLSTTRFCSRNSVLFYAYMQPGCLNCALLSSLSVPFGVRSTSSVSLPSSWFDILANDTCTNALVLSYDNGGSVSAYRWTVNAAALELLGTALLPDLRSVQPFTAAADWSGGKLAFVAQTVSGAVQIVQLSLSDFVATAFALPAASPPTALVYGVGTLASTLLMVTPDSVVALSCSVAGAACAVQSEAPIAMSRVQLGGAAVNAQNAATPLSVLGELANSVAMQGFSFNVSALVASAAATVQSGGPVLGRGGTGAQERGWL